MNIKNLTRPTCGLLLFVILIFVGFRSGCQTTKGNVKSEKNIIISVQDKAQLQIVGSSLEIKNEASGIQTLSLSLNKNRDGWVPKEISLSNGLRFRCGGGTAGDALLSL